MPSHWEPWPSSSGGDYYVSSPEERISRWVEEDKGGRTDWARPTQTQEVPLLCGKCFIITAKAFCLSHRFLFLKDPRECSLPSVHGFPNTLSMEPFKLPEAKIIHPSAHILHSRPVLCGFIRETANICLRSAAVNSCCRQLNIRKTAESRWKAANYITDALK